MGLLRDCARRAPLRFALPGRRAWGGGAGFARPGRRPGGWAGGPPACCCCFRAGWARPGTSVAALGPGLPVVWLLRCLPSLGRAAGHAGRVSVVVLELGCPLNDQAAATHFSDLSRLPIASEPGKLGVTAVPPSLRARVTVRWSTRSPGVGLGWLFAIWSGTPPRNPQVRFAPARRYIAVAPALARAQGPGSLAGRTFGPPPAVGPGGAPRGALWADRPDRAGDVVRVL